MDVSQWPSQWAATGGLLLRSRALRWLTPLVRIELTQANGQHATLDMAQGLARPAVGSAAAGARAIELLPEQVLRRQLVLPRLGTADLARAVALEVAAITPFPPERTASAFSVLPGEGETFMVDLALTSTHEIDKRLQAVGAGGDNPPEVWVLPAGTEALRHEFAPLVFQGYGGAERRRLNARGLGLRGGLLALALLLIACLAVTPAAQTRMRAIQAQAAFDQLSKEAAPQLAQREKIVKQTERLQAIAKLAEQQLAPLPVLNMLTRNLPDGSWLSNLRLEGGKVTITGAADDTAALVRSLGGQPGVLGVRSPSPATRMGRSDKESFTLELTLDPAVYGVLRTGAAP
ncbi:PilN domain-containing protein [bacterium BD-1]|nr:PilN domain-containing protein [Ottowia caeni]